MTKTKEIKISTDELSLFYGKNIALKNVDIKINSNKVTALIGPSG